MEGTRLVADMQRCWNTCPIISDGGGGRKKSVSERFFFLNAGRKMNCCLVFELWIHPCFLAAALLYRWHR